MNLRLLAGAALAAASLAGTALAGTASAHPAPSVSGSTATANHPDTTSVSGPATISSDNGPVWAFDKLGLRITSVRTAVNTYRVEVDANGTFKGFADPRTGNALRSAGTVRGWLDLTVTSPSAPSRLYLPRREPGSMSQSAIVAQFFGGVATSVVGGHYDYHYYRVGGSVYEQQG